MDLLLLLIIIAAAVGLPLWAAMAHNANSPTRKRRR